MRQACWPRSAAETDQGVVGDVMASLHGDLLNGVGHVLDRDGQKSLGQLLRQLRKASGGGDLRGQRFEGGPHAFDIQFLVSVRAEHGREGFRADTAEEHVAVRYGERTTASVGGRTRVRARRLRPNPQARPVEPTDRAAPRRHRMDPQHGRPDPHAREDAVGGALQLARIMGDVRGRAPHVEADQPLASGRLRGADHADHPASRPGEDGVATPERTRRSPSRRWTA